VGIKTKAPLFSRQLAANKHEKEEKGDEHVLFQVPNQRHTEGGQCANEPVRMPITFSAALLSLSSTLLKKEKKVSLFKSLSLIEGKIYVCVCMYI